MTDLKGKTEKELLRELSEKREALAKFRFGISGSKLKNVKEGKTIRKDIARIETVLNNK